MLPFEDFHSELPPNEQDSQALVPYAPALVGCNKPSQLKRCLHSIKTSPTSHPKLKMLLSPSKHTAPFSPMTPPTPIAHDSFSMSYHQYTPGVRMSPRRKIHNTPGWPSTMPMDFPETIRMYNDPEEQDETVNFTMNPEFIESMAPGVLIASARCPHMQRFLPSVSPTKVKMLEPWKDMQDDIIEIPDGAGLCDHTRNDLVELWTSGDDVGFHDPYTPDWHVEQYKIRNAKLNKTIRLLVQELERKEKETQRIPPLEKKLISLQTQLKSLALVPMTPLRTSSLRNNIAMGHSHSQSLSHTPSTASYTSAKENIPPRQMSPRKPLKDMSNGPLGMSDTEEFIEQSKRIMRNIQVENTTLKERIEDLESQLEQQPPQQQPQQQSTNAAAGEMIDSLQREMEKLSKENHRLEGLLQHSRRQTTELLLSPQSRRQELRTGDRDAEIERLSEELAWHAKLHLYAEKERLRLLDLLEFAGTEGKVVVREYGVLREKLSRISLRDQVTGGSVISDTSSGKCLL